MNPRIAWSTLWCFMTCLCLVRADEPRAALLAPIEEPAPSPTQAEGAKAQAQDPKKAPDKAKDLLVPPKTDVFSDAILPPREAQASFTPQMMGDYGGNFVRQTFTVTGYQTIVTKTFNTELQTTTITTTKVPFSQTQDFLGRGAVAGPSKSRRVKVPGRSIASSSTTTSTATSAPPKAAPTTVSTACKRSTRDHWTASAILW